MGFVNNGETLFNTDETLANGGLMTNGDSPINASPILVTTVLMN